MTTSYWPSSKVLASKLKAVLPRLLTLTKVLSWQIGIFCMGFFHRLISLKKISKTKEGRFDAQRRHDNQRKKAMGSFGHGFGVKYKAGQMILALSFRNSKLDGDPLYKLIRIKWMGTRISANVSEWTGLITGGPPLLQHTRWEFCYICICVCG